MTDHPTAPASPLNAARQVYEAELDAIDRWHLNSLTDAAGDLIAALEAALAAVTARAEDAETALKPFADDYHWHLDWNRKHPQEIPQTYSEWLERKDPVSIASAVRHVYDLLYPQANAATRAPANGDGA